MPNFTACSALEEGLRPRLEGRVLVDVGEEPHPGEPGVAEQAREPPTTVGLGVDVRGDLREDAIGQRAIRMGDGDGPEVLVLKPDSPAAAADARHLAHAQRIADVQY